VSEVAEDEPEKKGLCARIRCCRCSRKKVSTRVESSFFNKPHFKGFEHSKSQVGIIKSMTNRMMYSLEHVLGMDKEMLGGKRFSVEMELPQQSLQVQIKRTQYNDDGVEVIMLQFIDMSATIKCDEQSAANELLELINACISHELRNPLNSIIA